MLFYDWLKKKNGGNLSMERILIIWFWEGKYIIWFFGFVCVFRVILLINVCIEGWGGRLVVCFYVVEECVW